MNSAMLIALAMGCCSGAAIGTSASVLFFDEDAGPVKKLYHAFLLSMGVTLAIVIFQRGTQIWALFGA